jgi:transcriptional regulator NrdR family protein
MCFCPKCEFLKSQVLESKFVYTKKTIRRRRKCLRCDFRFTTEEQIISALPLGPKLFTKRPKRTKRFGSSNPQSVLLEDNVRDLRARYEKGENMRELSVVFGISISQISRIINRKAWTQV